MVSKISDCFFNYFYLEDKTYIKYDFIAKISKEL